MTSFCSAPTFMIYICNFSYFQAGGSPEHVIEKLSSNYKGVAQMANLMAEWLILAGKTENSLDQSI